MKRSEDNNEEPIEKKRFVSNRWQNCLFDSIKDSSLLVLKEDLFSVIKDKYPKSRHHWLIIPNQDIGIDSVIGLSRSELQLIVLMSNKGKEMSQQMDKSIEFRFGFHTIPSLKPLHLHVISQDFDSKYLKTKKHYNSFTTKFFIDSNTVIQNLKDYGRVKTIGRQECEQLLKQDIVCHFCRLKIPNIPQLKTHLLRHFPKI